MSVGDIVKRFAKERLNLLPMLQSIEENEGYLSPEDIAEVSRYLDLSENDVFSVASFYNFRFARTAPDSAEPARSPEETSPWKEEEMKLGVIRPGEVRVILRNAGLVDPENIEDYIGNGGYEGLARTLTMNPAGIFAEAAAHGFTGRKLQVLADYEGDRWLGCNACNGIGRILLENDPHTVLEGMLIASHATGAARGLIFINNSGTSAAMSRLRIAIAQAIEREFLKIPVEIAVLPPSFLLMEETALINAYKGYRAIPGLPVDPAFIYTAEAFARIGAVFRKEFSNTKVFVLRGDTAHPGIVEVPSDTTLRKVIFELGGGFAEGKSFKAVQTGGPTGEWVSENFLDGYAPGGSLLVAADDRCAVDLALEAIAFLEKESCGRCVYCREGAMQMAEVLKDIVEGRGKPSDLDLLIDIGAGMQKGSFCVIGKKAANPVLTTIRDFREEYEAHIKERRCPARSLD